MSKEITRKIHFFDFKIYELQQGSNSFHQHSNVHGLFESIAQLQFIGDQKLSRFMYLPNNDVLFIDANVQGDKIYGKFALSRRSALPELEEQGILKQLNIPPNSGLAEVTHFVYFCNHNVIGVEFNFHGPRTNSLRDYLLLKSKNFRNPFEHIELNPILNQDIDQILNDMGEVNLVQMEVARNELNIIKDLDEDLYNAFDAASKVSEAESVEVILRKKKYSRDGFSFPFMKNKVKELLKIESNREKINKFKAVADSRSEETTKSFDLLSDKMITSKKVATLDKRSRSVDSDNMFEKIDEAFEDLKPNF